MTAFGFVPVGTTDGSDYHGKMRDVILDTGANAFLGDMMITGTQAAADETIRVTPSTAVTDVTTLVGALVEIYPDFTDEGSLTTNFHESGADGEGRLTYGRDVIYEAREDADTTAITGALLGDNRGIAYAAGNQITGVSGMQIDSDSAAEQMTLLRLGLQSGNDYVAAGAVGAIFQCKIATPALD